MIASNKNCFEDPWPILRKSRVDSELYGRYHSQRRGKKDRGETADGAWLPEAL